MILSAFTIFHVVLSLLGIGSGFVVLYGLLTTKSFNGWTSVFLITTLSTSVTGFLFPFHGFTPAQGVGIVSLIVLGFAIAARYRFRLAGGWRRTFAITSVIALYLNVFVLIVQLFQQGPRAQGHRPNAVGVAIPGSATHPVAVHRARRSRRNEISRRAAPHGC